MLDTPSFQAKMATLARRHEEVAALLSTAEVIGKRAEFLKLSREHAELDPLIAAWRAYRKLLDDLAAAQVMVASEPDPELRELAREEVGPLEAQRDAAEHALKLLLLPRDPNDAKNTILEIRAGTGGDEAALFAGDLFRMYLRYAERHGWKVELMSTSDGTAGGFKEVVALIEGKDVFSRLKFESGVHRVQRVPATEAQGRIHTSAATVAVLPEAEEVDVRVEDQGPAHRRVPLERRRRPARQHHRLGGAHHPPADRHRRRLSGRTLADQEQGQGDEGAAGTHARGRAAEA